MNRECRLTQRDEVIRILPHPQNERIDFFFLSLVLCARRMYLLVLSMSKTTSYCIH